MNKRNIGLELAATYTYLINHCRPETVTEPRVIDLLHTARKYMASYNGDLNAAEAVRMRVSLRNAAGTLLKQADWLGVNAQQELISFIKEQPEFLSEGDFRFTADSFSSNIEQWRRDLGHFTGRPNLAFLEVGSFEGKSACWLLQNILTDESSRLTCVDVFVQQRSQGIYDTTGLDSASMSSEDRFDYNIRQTGAKHRVLKLKGESGVVLRTLSPSSHDFIYIDGSHIARDVLEDGVLAWRLLKTGGLITFDDYLWKDHPDPLLCPQIAIDAFLAVYKGNYRIIHHKYQLTLEKLS